MIFRSGVFSRKEGGVPCARMVMSAHEAALLLLQ